MYTSSSTSPSIDTGCTDRQLILVTGAARSGKSEWAETIATGSGQAVTYIATATIDPTDIEWQNRISLHQQRRPSTWQTISEITDLALTIRQAGAGECLLVDSLGTWVANLLDLAPDEWDRTSQDFISACALPIPQSQTIILVAEETGWGVIPAYTSGRLFRDRLGTLTRRIGSIASVVYLVTGGHVLNLSQLGSKLDSID